MKIKIKIGGDEEIRTLDLSDANRTLSRLSYAPTKWRRRWDSNPRAPEGNRISSAARYDHFDTSPIAIYIVYSNFSKLSIFFNEFFFEIRSQTTKTRYKPNAIPNKTRKLTRISKIVS